MTVATRQPDSEAPVPTHGTDEGSVWTLRPRPHALTEPGFESSRVSELVAALAWIVRSWLSPAEADAIKKQRTRRTRREQREP
jgi:hypothetical protein